MAQLLKQFKEVQSVMKGLGGLGTKARKSKRKTKKGKGGGGRVTDSKAARARVPKGLELPGLDSDGNLDLSGFGDLPGLKK